MKKNAAQPDAAAPLNAYADLINGQSAQVTALTRRFASEATHFWARRMRAYAAHMDMLAECANPSQLMDAQTRFMHQLQTDYAQEGAAFAEILSQPSPHANGAGAGAPH